MPDFLVVASDQTWVFMITWQVFYNPAHLPKHTPQECVFLNSKQASFHLWCGWGKWVGLCSQDVYFYIASILDCWGKWPGTQRSSVSGTHDYSVASLLWEKSKCHFDFWFAFMVIDESHAPISLPVFFLVLWYNTLTMINSGSCVPWWPTIREVCKNSSRNMKVETVEESSLLVPLL